jgi:Stress responsive A/B Barrel Domain
MTLQHIVLFSFPGDLSQEEADQMRDMVASWPTRIGLMTSCRLGTDLTGRETAATAISSIRSSLTCNP